MRGRARAEIGISEKHTGKKRTAMQKLKPRMAAAAAFAREGKRFADVGTDHAYLAVSLCESGFAPGGVASDIHKGPLDRARQNIAAAGLSDRIVLHLGNGLDGLQAEAPEDIYILGMGGELIADILSRAPWVQNGNVRLILQPMTHQRDLRTYLLGNGFSILDETLTEEDGRIYQILCAAYDGNVRTWDDAELTVGKINLAKGGEVLGRYCENLASNLETAATGIEKSGKSADEQRRLAEKLRKIAGRTN